MIQLKITDIFSTLLLPLCWKLSHSGVASNKQEDTFSAQEWHTIRVTEANTVLKLSQSQHGVA
jgi:hypothetical protein